jgi:hypothetical protein
MWAYHGVLQYLILFLGGGGGIDGLYGVHLYLLATLIPPKSTFMLADLTMCEATTNIG